MDHRQNDTGNLAMDRKMRKQIKRKSTVRSVELLIESLTNGLSQVELNQYT